MSCDRDTYEAVAACAIFVAKVGAQLGELGTVCNLCDYPPDDFAALGSACAKARAIAIFLSNGSLRSLQQLAVIAESIHAARATSDVSRVAAVVPIYLRGFAVPGDDYFTMVLPVLVPNMGSILGGAGGQLMNCCRIWPILTDLDQLWTICCRCRPKLAEFSEILAALERTWGGSLPNFGRNRSSLGEL